MMKKYRYSGPTSGVTLKDGKAVKEIMLHTGGEIALPEDHEYTRTLLALGYLTLQETGGRGQDSAEAAFSSARQPKTPTGRRDAASATQEV
jgi:hypothetical protein